MFDDIALSFANLFASRIGIGARLGANLFDAFLHGAFEVLGGVAEGALSVVS